MNEPNKQTETPVKSAFDKMFNDAKAKADAAETTVKDAVNKDKELLKGKLKAQGDSDPKKEDPKPAPGAPAPEKKEDEKEKKYSFGKDVGNKTIEDSFSEFMKAKAVYEEKKAKISEVEDKPSLIERAREDRSNALSEMIRRAEILKKYIDEQNRP